MARAKRYWLFKSEPDVYSIDDLKRDGSTYWEGVRNYQARNLLRDDIKKGDEVLFYHSRIKPMGVAGIAKVTRGGYADPSQFDKKHKYFDPKANEDNVRWYVVDLSFVSKFDEVVTLEDLKAEAKLADMMVVQRGARLSIQPVTAAEFKVVKKMGTA
ncbi:MAG: EVE domain-containing protein [Planctomycetota bacterium]|nr:EVE domain-containing protein [Planctomycetota bacterium]